MSKPISSLMKHQVWSVDIDDTVDAVEQFLALKRLSLVPVRDSDGPVVGVISAADLLRFHAEKKDPSTVRAWQLCTFKPIEVSVGTSISEVARLMVERQIHHVLVMESGAIKGIVSSLDFVQTFVSES